MHTNQSLTNDAHFQTMTERLDTQTIIDALNEVNDVVVGDIYTSWVSVMRHGALLGFLVHNGVKYSFRPTTDAMLCWWHDRPETDDENP